MLCYDPVQGSACLAFNYSALDVVLVSAMPTQVSGMITISEVTATALLY